MNDRLPIEELRTLISERDTLCVVSIYLPTHKAHPGTEVDPIRLKNLLAQAEEQLLAADRRRTDVSAQLKPGYDLLDNQHFWQHQSDGLALFLSPETFHVYRTPLRFQELVVVGPRFHVKPLISMAGNRGEYYLLAISQNDLRLYHGSRVGVEEVDLPMLPRSLDEALKYDDPEKQLQFHTGTGAHQQAHRRSAIFHGHGSGVDDHKDRLLRYCRQVDDGLSGVLQNAEVPLVLAGVESLLSIYREINSYPHLIDNSVSGNPEHFSPEQLHGRVLAIVEPYNAIERDKAKANYARFAGTKLTSNEIREVVPAAYHGRIETLFVVEPEQCWGVFNKDTAKIHLHSVPRPDNEDLLDAAAVQTILHDGTVFVDDPQDMPDGPLVAAVFRY